MPKARSPKRGKTRVGLKAARLTPLSLKSLLTSRQKIRRSSLAMVMVMVAAVGGFVIYKSLAAPGYDTSPNAYDAVGQTTLKNDPARGLNYDGLKLVKANADHPCKGRFEAVGLKANGKPLCTHGPDAIPEGLSIAETTIEKRLAQLEQLPKGLTNEAQLKKMTTDQLFAYAGHPFANGIPFPETAVPCTSGSYRIQLVFITNRGYPNTTASYFRSTARRMETQLEYSSLHSGNGSTKRRYRFVTDSNCSPVVKIVRTPDTYKLATPGSVVSYLQDRMNMKNPYTKYLIWNYGGAANFCGMAFGSGSEDPSVTGNIVNRTAGYAVVDTTCWGTRTETHEIAHVLGAVGKTAPRGNGAGHCIDRRDPLCVGDTIVQNCTDPILEYILDCNKNDYFNTGTISSSSYLYDHWNIAKSPYLLR